MTRFVATAFVVLMSSCLSFASARAEEPPTLTAPEAKPSIWDDIHAEEASFLGLAASEGVAPDRSMFRPKRELRLGNKTVVSLDGYSAHVNVRVDADRDLANPQHPIDEPYAPKRLYLMNGSVIDRNDQFIVREAFVQKVTDDWLLQIGSQAYTWGVADSVNPMSVFGASDLRSGLAGDKDGRALATPSARFALLGDFGTLNFVYAPWQQPSLAPSLGQNWYANADNLSFQPQIVPAYGTQKNRPSYAIKYDTSVGQGDLSLLYYQGGDNELNIVPQQLAVQNNQPLILDLQQVQEQKTVYGGSLSQTVGAWVLKAEGTYSPNKRSTGSVNLTNIQNQPLPLPLKKTGAYETTVGFNYFTPIRKALGFSLGETVLTVEYYRERFLASGLLAPTLSDLVVTNLRTAAMEDRLELFVTYLADVAKAGGMTQIKATFNAETLKHTLTYAHFAAAAPGSGQLGSLFYYWRNNDYVSYEVSYPF